MPLEAAYPACRPFVLTGMSVGGALYSTPWELPAPVKCREVVASVVHFRQGGRREVGETVGLARQGPAVRLPPAVAFRLPSDASSLAAAPTNHLTAPSVYQATHHKGDGPRVVVQAAAVGGWALGRRTCHQCGGSQQGQQGVGGAARSHCAWLDAGGWRKGG